MQTWSEGENLTFFVLDESSKECTTEDERGIVGAIAGAKRAAAFLFLGTRSLLGRKCLHALRDDVLITGAHPGDG